MNTRRHLSRCYLMKSRRATTCALPAESLASAAIFGVGSGDHNSLCLSLSIQLSRRGLIPFAQKVMQRIIACSSSIADALSVLDFAKVRGVELDVGCYGALIRKLVETKELRSAESFYREHLTGAGIEPDSSILNSMVVCWCQMGKFEEARAHFDRILLMDSVPSKIACHTLLREFFAQEMFLEAFDYFVRIIEYGIDLGIWAYNSLIDGLCDKSHLEEAIQILDIMEERMGLPPTLRSYKSLFYSLCRIGCVSDAEALVEDIESDGYFIDKIMYTSLIRGYCKQKQMKMAMRVYYQMLKKGCDMDNYVYNTLIQGFMKMGLFDKGWFLFNQMTEQGMQPNVVTYNIMIDSYCKEGKMDCASWLWETMTTNNVVPNRHCYTTLIKSSLHKEKCSLQAIETYSSMIDSGVIPDHILFFVLLKVFPKGHELDLALMTLETIAKNGCGLDTSLLNSAANLNSLEQKIDFLVNEIADRDLNLATVAFAVFITAFCARGRIGAALQYLEKLKRLGCKPLLFSYNSLIKCLCQHGLFMDAKSLLACMQDDGVLPDQSTYLIFVNEYCKRRDVESALDMLDEMDMRGLEPTVAICDSIVGCLGRERRISEAEDVFNMIPNPDDIAYLTMINAYSVNGKTLKALQLFEMMVENAIQPTSYTYTALISGLVKKGMTDKGCIYLNKMLEEGLYPNTVLYTSLIDHFLRKREVKFTFRLIYLMCRSQIEFDHVTYMTLVKGICKNVTNGERYVAVMRNSDQERETLFQLLREKAVERSSISCPSLSEGINSISCPSSSEGMKSFALKLIEEVKTNFTPDLYLCNSMISGLRKLGKMEDAHKQFELMQREGVTPNQVTYTILMNGHIRAGEVGAAIALFNRMNAQNCLPDGVIYNALLKGLCQAGRLVDVLMLVYMMRKRGLYPSKASYRMLLHCLYAHEFGVAAFRIFKEMVELDLVPGEVGHKWRLLCRSNKKLHEAHLLFDSMLQSRESLFQKTVRPGAEMLRKQRKHGFAVHGET